MTPPRARKGRRKLNQPLIKSVIVLFAGMAAAAGSAACGLAAHLGFAPMLTWMFGYSPEKAQGTALRFSLISAVATLVTFFWLELHLSHPGSHNQTAIQSSGVIEHLLRGVLLMVGATIGALLTARVTPKPTATGVLRALQAIAVIGAIFTVTEATHLSAVTRSNAHYALLASWWQIGLLGVTIGGITQGARLTAGSLMVPALFFLTAMPNGAGALRPLTAAEAVAEALTTVVLAGLLPSWGYAQKGLVDGTYLTAAVVGGLIGGFAGGWLLTLLLDRTILVFCGVVVMFFAAREIARLAGAPTEPPPVDGPEPSGDQDPI